MITKFYFVFFFLVLLLGGVGCSSSPSLSRGGLAEHHIELLDPYYENTPISQDNSILFEFEMLRQQLAILVLEGAKFCFPATVIELRLIEKRIARQITGNMMFDATNDIIVLRHLAHRLERQLDYVLENEVCIPPISEPPKNKQDSTSPDHEVKESDVPTKASQLARDLDDGVATSNSVKKLEQKDVKLTNVLSLLHADNQFALNSSEVNLKYVGRLAVAAEILASMPEINITITGYADSQGLEEANKTLGEQRAQNVLRYLHAFGVPKNRMQVLSRGELDPLFLGEAPHILLTNRRVEIQLISASMQQSE